MNIYSPSGKSRSPHTVFSIVACLAVLLSLAGCSKDPIFAAIEQEVELKDPTMVGQIPALVEAGGMLYTTNGRLYKRTGGTGNWTKIPMPEYRCADLATDGTNLYVLFQDSDWKFASLRMYDGTNWTTSVTGLSGVNVGKISSGNGRIYIFGYSATVTTNYLVYSATVTTATAISGTFARPVGGSGDYFATESAVYDETGTPLTLDAGMPANSIHAIVTKNANLYVISTGNVYRWDGSSWTTNDHKTSSPSGVAYLTTSAGPDLLLICGKSGYSEVTVNNATGAMIASQNPGDNATSSVDPANQSQYENSLGDYPLSAIYAVSSPTTPATDDYVIYASVIDTKNDGLWSYYFKTQTEWNRE